MSFPPPPPLNNKPVPTVTITTPRGRSPSDASLSIKTPRTARFAEATAVHSPIDPSQNSNPFADPPTNHYMPQPQISDVGFGYMGKAGHVSVEVEETDSKYLPPPSRDGLNKPMPLKSALKSPGAAPRNMEAILSPTFKDTNEKFERDLEKAEKLTEKEQAKDLKAKVRVRWAKFIMRGVSFSCSLIVLAMVSTVLTIFRMTVALPPRNGLPAWAPNTTTWPQIVLLTIASISLVIAIVIFYGYWRGGHKRAEKVAVYYTTFAVAFFILSIVMWGIGAAVLSQAKKNGEGKDLWGWSCKDNKRRELFKDDVSYSLACRLQDWALICCIIEVVVEVITIAIYGIVFFRYYSKRRLRKSMAVRDKARSDMYLAQLKNQTAPNTPGLGPSGNGLLSPRDGGWQPPQGYESYNKERSPTPEEGVQYAIVNERKVAEPKPFTLKAPPMKGSTSTPKIKQVGFGAAVVEDEKRAESPEKANEHVPAAPGEMQYAQVAIPGAYTLNSPGFAPQHGAQNGFDFGLDSRIAKK